MKTQHIIPTILMIVCVNLSFGQTDSLSLEERNKAIARGFYEDLWFNNRTENYTKYMAETYTAHDIGDRKGIRESAIEQKKIADFFWENGDLNCTMDFQVAENNLVATRWTVAVEPKTLFGRILIGRRPIPIINVFRIENGKIVELWNHRHDIDTPQTLKFWVQGLLIGLLIALFPTILAIRYRRKLKKLA